MIAYVLIGGMKGTTWVQIIKAALLIIGALVMTLWVLAKYGFNFSALLGAPSTRPARPGGSCSGRARSTARPGLTKLDFLSLGARAGAGHRGPAARPDALLHRADGAEARRSVVSGRSA